jgi:hypothetical protein
LTLLARICPSQTFHTCSAGAETGFSMIKRRLGSGLGGRTYQSQCREIMLMVLTFNLMLE